MDNKKLIDFIKFTGLGLVMLGVVLSYKIIPYRISYNFSNSEPKGFYLVHITHNVHYSVGDLVVVCVPDEKLAKIAIKRKYLGKGPCEFKTSYEIKQIAAFYPTVIYVNNEEIVLNKLKLKILNNDSKGRPLLSKLNNTTIIPKDSYFVVGTTPNSFDSRYYGAVSLKYIKGFVIPLITW